MASKRDAKKLISYLTLEVMDDCFSFILTHPKRDNEDVIDIIGDMDLLQNEMTTRINHIDGKDNPALVKEHFNSMYDTLITSTDEALKQLSEIAKK